MAWGRVSGPRRSVERDLLRGGVGRSAARAASLCQRRRRRTTQAPALTASPGGGAYAFPLPRSGARKRLRPRRPGRSVWYRPRCERGL